MKKIPILFISITILFACSKSDVIDDISKAKKLAGKYVMTEGPFTRPTSVYIDDSKISFLSVSNDYGTRTRDDKEIDILSDSEIKIVGATHTVAWNGDKLTLDNGNFKYVLIKDSDAPTAEQWVTTINLESKIKQSTFVKQAENPRVYDLTFYNGFVYTSGHENLKGKYVLTKINLSDFSTTQVPIPNDNITTLGYGDNIEYVGSNKFWVYEWGNPDDYMYEFEEHTLKETKKILMPNKFDYGYQLAYNGSDLYGAIGTGIRKWNFVGQTWGPKIELSGRFGLTLDNEYLYTSDGNIIHKYSLNPIKAVAAYNVSKDNKYFLFGMTLTSKNQIVASVHNYDNADYEIVTITLP